MNQKKITTLVFNYTWHFLLSFSLLLSSIASAHKPSDSYLMIHAEQENTTIPVQATAQLDIALRDLDFAIGLDRNGDGQITWKELRTAQTSISSYALSRITFEANHQRCQPQFNQLMFDQHVDGGYAVLTFNLHCPTPSEHYTVHYRMFFDIDRLHKSIVVFQHAGVSETFVLSADQNTANFSIRNNNHWKQWLNFVKEGMWHIWQGFDHILFIISLLLPAVMVCRNHRWYPAEQFKEVLKDTIGIVTAFTLSHSITLSLAAFHVVSLPSRLVESCIALSVVAVALNNVYPIVHRRRWMVTFLFGLIHGFGFASNLLELGLPTTALLRSVLGFNIGVEIGQLVIVLLILPIVFSIRKYSTYLYVGMRGGSMLITIIASMWFIERVFNKQWMPF